MLKRCFTQNIDSLETQAGLPTDKLIAAHGNFDTSSCIECSRLMPNDMVKASIMKSEVLSCPDCSGLVKPNIVFFGEGLPPRFFRGYSDFQSCQLLIVMGTSLSVHPFASLIHRVGKDVPRLLINNQIVGEAWDKDSKGLYFGEGNIRDAKFIGDCDDGVEKLCELLGWKDELMKLAGRSGGGTKQQNVNS